MKGKAARWTGLLIAILATESILMSMTRAGDHSAADSRAADPDWSQLIASMDKMHMAMGEIQRSDNSDVDFVRLMLPHHQAAIDMARTQLIYGKDQQMRRLALEIITDQQSEIELMQRWLRQQRAQSKRPAAVETKQK